MKKAGPFRSRRVARQPAGRNQRPDIRRETSRGNCASRPLRGEKKTEGAPESACPASVACLVSSDRALPRSRGPMSNESAAGQRISVLVIEDYIDSADTMARFLHLAAGFDVRVAYDGATGQRRRSPTRRAR